MEFVAGHTPPARQGRTDQQVCRYLLPDQGLNVFRSNEVFFCGRQYVGQLGQRANQIGASTGRRSLVEQFRSLPELGHAHDGFARKIVRTHKERIVVQDLGARRLVVGVIQADQRVPEKRRKLAAGGFQLRTRTGRLDYFGNVNVHLQLAMTVGVDSGRPFCLLALGKDRAGQLEFLEFVGQGDQVAARGRSLRHARKPVTECESTCRATPGADRRARPAFCRPSPGGCAGLRETAGEGPLAAQ